MTYQDSDQPARTASGLDGYVAAAIVVQHTPHGVLVTRVDGRARNPAQTPPRR